VCVSCDPTRTRTQIMEKSKKYVEYAQDAANIYNKWQRATSKEDKINLWADFELVSKLRDSFQHDRHAVSATTTRKKRKTTTDDKKTTTDDTTDDKKKKTDDTTDDTTDDKKKKTDDKKTTTDKKKKKTAGGIKEKKTKKVIE